MLLRLSLVVFIIIYFIGKVFIFIKFVVWKLLFEFFDDGGFGNIKNILRWG